MALFGNGGAATACVPHLHSSSGSPPRSIQVLLVESDAGDARQLKAVMEGAKAASFEVHHVDDPDHAREVMASGTTDVVLLALRFADRSGMDAVARMLDWAPEVPLVVLTRSSNSEGALHAVRAGAQDHLDKDEITSRSLERAIRYAMERHRLLAQHRRSSWVDELTGIYNRRGFLRLAKQRLEEAAGSKQSALLLFADVDNLKRINDSLGHAQGDHALAETARLLTRNLPAHDLIGRWGGDEFAALISHASSADAPAFRGRVLQNLRRLNASGALRCTLALSIGTADYDPEEPCTLDELLERADAQMYRDKRCESRTARPAVI